MGSSKNSLIAGDVCEGVGVDPVNISVDGDLNWRFSIARGIDAINPAGKLIQVIIKENDAIVFQQTLDGSLLSYNSTAKSYGYQGTGADPWKNLSIKRHAANRTAIQLRITGVNVPDPITGKTPLDPNLFTKSIGFQIGNENFSIISDEWQFLAAGAWRLTDTGIPDQTFCATRFQNDPAWVKWGKDGALDHFHIGALMPSSPVLLSSTRPVSMSLIDSNGRFLFSWTVDASQFLQRSSQGKPLYTYVNKSAKFNGGVWRVIINPHGKAYQIQFSAYGNLKQKVNATGGMLEIQGFVDQNYITPLTQWSPLRNSMGYQLRRFTQ